MTALPRIVERVMNSPYLAPMTPSQHNMLTALRPLLGEKGLVTAPELIEPWLTDWRGRYRGAAPAILAPANVDEVQAIVRNAAEHRVALVPQGGNTSMVGGATPPPDGSALILSLRRLNRVRSVDRGAGLAVAEAGVILADLQAAAIEAGCRFPLTLGSRGSATIGGLVSTNAGGTQVLRWGTMRGLVAGVEAVLPDGSRHDGLAALKKDNRGYSLDHLLIGAEGTLGIVTAATLRVVPAIAARGVAWVSVNSPAAGLALLRQLRASTEAIESFEIMPDESLQAALAHLPGSRAPLAGRHSWHVLIEAVAADVNDEDPTQLLQRLLTAALERGGIDDAVIAANEAQAELFWRLRDSLSDAERALGPATQHDIAVPVEAMPGFMVDAAAIVEGRFPGTHASGFGHLGDGNIHFHVRAPSGADRDRWLGEQAPTISRFVHELVISRGGTISAEHGIGQMKLQELERLSSPADREARRSIKRAIDPLGLFNPGKLVSLAPAVSTP